MPVEVAAPHGDDGYFRSHVFDPTEIQRTARSVVGDFQHSHPGGSVGLAEACDGVGFDVRGEQERVRAAVQARDDREIVEKAATSHVLGERVLYVVASRWVQYSQPTGPGVEDRLSLSCRALSQSSLLQCHP